MNQKNFEAMPYLPGGLRAVCRTKIEHGPSEVARLHYKILVTGLEFRR